VTKRDLSLVLSVLTLAAASIVIFHLLNKIDIAQAIELLVTIVLVAVTTVNVLLTGNMAKATKIQAEASVKMVEEANQQALASFNMVEEARKQRIIESRPVVIQKPVLETETQFRAYGSKEWFSWFHIYNAGNGPAIEVEVSLLNKDKELIHSHRYSFLRTGEQPIEFHAKELFALEESSYHLVTEYKSIFSDSQKPMWYQTWLPFKTVKTNEKEKIYVQSGELEFREVSEKDRIDAFNSRSKPK
jgi:hypothetical protein